MSTSYDTDRGRRTAVEGATNCGHDDLQAEQATHDGEYGAIFFVDCVNADDVDEGRSGEEDGGADGLEQEEVRALLGRGLHRN